MYKDSEDRLIATTQRPYLSLGETAVLEVKDVTGIGAFLDWGLAKDLLLPFNGADKKSSLGRTRVSRFIHRQKQPFMCNYEGV